LLKRYATAIAFSTALAFIVPAGVDAASYETSTTAVQIGDVSYYRSETTADSIRFAQVLSSHYHQTIPASEVIRLKADFDFGFGDISMMYAVADYSGVPVDDVVSLRRKHMGWGEIAKIYGLKVQELKHRHEVFVDDAHVHGLSINYIEINDYDGYHADNSKHDYDRDKNHDESYEQDRNQVSHYENDRDQGKNNDQHDKGKGDKQGNKKVFENNGKGNGHK
jgi:hypothetical protein